MHKSSSVKSSAVYKFFKRERNALQAYRDVLAHQCKGALKPWSTELQHTLTNYLKSPDRVLDLSELPRGCLPAAAEVFDAFIPACASLGLSPEVLRLPPSLKGVPEWVQQCDTLEWLELPKYAGRQVDVRLPALRMLELPDLHRNVRKPLTVLVPGACKVEGVLADGRRAKWARETTDAGDTLMTLRPAALHFNGRVKWSDTAIARRDASTLDQAGLEPDEAVLCRHLALIRTRLWAEATARETLGMGSDAVSLNSADAIVREADPALQAWFSDLEEHPACADVVSVAQWQPYMQATWQRMQGKGEVHRFGLLCTPSHVLPLRLNGSNPARPVAECEDPNFLFTTQVCEAPFSFDGFFHKNDPSLYLEASAAMVLMPPLDASSPPRYFQANKGSLVNHVLVIWLDDPMDLRSSIANKYRPAQIDTTHMGDTLTPALLAELVRVGADAGQINAALEAHFQHHANAPAAFLELFASFSDTHTPPFIVAVARDHLPLVKVLGSALVSASALGMATDIDILCILNAVNRNGHSAMRLALESEGSRPVETMGNLVWSLWTHGVITGPSVEAFLRDSARHFSEITDLNVVAALRNIVQAFREDGALTGRQARSLLLQLDVPAQRLKRPDLYPSLLPV